MPATAFDEARRGSCLRASKAEKYVTFDASHSFGGPFDRREEIALIVFPNGLDSESKQNDIRILEVARHLRDPLITNDGASKSQAGGMLGNADQLLELGITVLTAEDALATAKRRIQESQSSGYERKLVDSA